MKHVLTHRIARLGREAHRLARDEAGATLLAFGLYFVVPALILISLLLIGPQLGLFVLIGPTGTGG